MLDSIYEILAKIDASDTINDYKNKKLKALKDEELLSLIKEYNINNDIKIKTKILSNTNYEEFKEAERKIYLLIMDINKKFKSLKFFIMYIYIVIYMP